MNLAFYYQALNGIVFLSLLGFGFYLNHQTYSKSTAFKRNLRWGGVLLAWQIYMYCIGKSGLLQDFSFPPKIALLLVLPAFTLIGLFVYRNRNSLWLSKLKMHQLILFQSYRLFIEILFVLSVGAGILHKNASIEGFNFDMVFALSAPVVAFVVYNYKSKANWLAKAWNIGGLLVIGSIILVIMTTIYFPEFYGPDTLPMPKAFGAYPYVIVAGFLMPTAVLLHILSLVCLRNSKLKNTEAKLQLA